ncbi:MAG: hypothetical protein OHK0017_06200 [Patescibacteria group bacterium]
MTLNIWYVVVFSIPFAVFTLYFILGNVLVFFYPKFDLKKHFALVEKYWAYYFQKHPSVDIFLTACGEELEVLSKTMHAISKLNYDNYKVYILDDKGDKDLEELTNKYNFNYRHRSNAGWMKKAGNLRYGYEISEGEFVIVFDADFVPHPDFIREALPYMADPEVGIVQTAQYFDTSDEAFRNNPLEAGSGASVENFYKVINPSRGAFDASICVGTNAIYRRQMIEDAGGNALSEYKEDVETGINCIRAGYKIKYIPLILAIGLSPDTLQAYFAQQNRWCTGSTMEDAEKPAVIKKPLSLAQKLWYSLGGLYYLRGALAIVMSLQTFLILTFNTDTVRLSHTIYFIPYIVLMYVIPNLAEFNRPRLGKVLAGVGKMYIYLYTILNNLQNKKVGWVATGNKAVRSSKSFVDFVRLVTISSASMYAFALYVVSTGALFSSWRVFVPSVSMLYLISIHGLFMVYSNLALFEGGYTIQAFSRLQKLFKPAVSANIIVILLTFLVQYSNPLNRVNNTTETSKKLPDIEVSA